MADLSERVAAANQKAWDEFPEPITHENVSKVRIIAARAAIAVCAEEMARIADEQADENDTGEGWLTGKSIADAIRRSALEAIGEKE